MKTKLLPWLLLCAWLPGLPAMAADDDVRMLVMADRFEYQENDEWLVWDAQGWIGGDYRKLWWKTEGEHESDGVEESRIDLLYSHALTPFFDLQLGLRHDPEPGPSRSFLTMGLLGLAPYWFEIDGGVFLSDDGDLSAELELESDWLLSQRLILQPRLELLVAGSNVADAGVGRGLSRTELGLRLRYEFSRRFAPLWV